MLLIDGFPIKGFFLYNYSKLSPIQNQRGLDMAENQNPEKWKQNIPDIYFDRMQLTTTVLGVNFILSVSDPTVIDVPEGGAERIKLPKTDVAVIRTSPTHAKLISMLIKKQLKRFEENTKTEIQIPEEVYKELGIDPSDW